MVIYRRKDTVIKYAKLSDVKDCRNPLNAECHIVTFVSYTRVSKMYFLNVLYWVTIMCFKLQ